MQRRDVVSTGSSRRVDVFLIFTKRIEFKRNSIYENRLVIEINYETKRAMLRGIYPIFFFFFFLWRKLINYLEDIKSETRYYLIYCNIREQLEL